MYAPAPAAPPSCASSAAAAPSAAARSGFIAAVGCCTLAANARASLMRWIVTRVSAQSELVPSLWASNFQEAGVW